MPSLPPASPPSFSPSLSPAPPLVYPISSLVIPITVPSPRFPHLSQFPVSPAVLPLTLPSIVSWTFLCWYRTVLIWLADVLYSRPQLPHGSLNKKMYHLHSSEDITLHRGRGKFYARPFIFFFVHVPSCLENPHTLFCEIVLCRHKLRKISWYIRSSWFKPIYIWKNYLIYMYIYSKVETYIVRKITYYISLNQLLPNILRNFSELVLTMYEVHRRMCQDLYP